MERGDERWRGDTLLGTVDTKHSSQGTHCELVHLTAVLLDGPTSPQFIPFKDMTRQYQ